VSWMVYVLKVSTGAFYIGATNNLDKRLKAHNSGKGSKYVRAHLPFTLFYVEPAPSKSAALKREAVLKKLTHEQKAKLGISK
jgi:putative endonuclease